MKNLPLIFFCLMAFGLCFAGTFAEAADFTVTTFGTSAYTFNGTSNNPTLTLVRGTTYTFQVNTPGHPFDIKTNNSTGSGNRYNKGVTGQGATSGTLTFAVPSDAPTPLRYNCEVHGAMTGVINLVDPPNMPPSVTITNPLAGAEFRAPTDLILRVSANDVDGTVTNVRFFSAAIPLGDVTNAPFDFTNHNLGAGNYSFTAIARDNFGGATTSAAVNVFLLTNAIIAVPIRLSDGRFVLTLSGIAGQSYMTEASTNLFNWTPIFTNTAPADLFNITDFTSPNVLQRFYRTRQDF